LLFSFRSSLFSFRRTLFSFRKFPLSSWSGGATIAIVWIRISKLLEFSEYNFAYCLINFLWIETSLFL
jgi:hypothetical protein